jgi:hypothetical protein
MHQPLNRRHFIRNTVLATTGLAASASRAADTPAPAAKPPAPAPQKLLPTGKIGELNVTRLILGGNLLTRYQHSRDLRYINKLVKSYNTDAKIRETVELAEASGINTLSVNVTPSVMMTLGDHRKNGGKIQTILYCTSNIEDAAHYREDLQKVADFGSEAVYLWGEQADRCFREKKMDVLRRALDDAKALGLPCGIGAHELQTIQVIEEQKWPADFYIKTLHHHKYPTAPHAGEAVKSTSEIPGYWCRNPEETIAFMANVTKPWIAFKIMAAGAIPPQDAFPYTFKNGGDFALAGMFDFDIAEDCQITRDAVEKAQTRARPWRA